MHVRIAREMIEHLEEAKKHQNMAADHRAASHALRDDEARGCVGIPDDDRDMSPFHHRDDIASEEQWNDLATFLRGPGSALARRLPVGQMHAIYKIMRRHKAR